MPHHIFPENLDFLIGPPPVNSYFREIDKWNYQNWENPMPNQGESVGHSLSFILCKRMQDGELSWEGYAAEQHDGETAGAADSLDSLLNNPKGETLTSRHELVSHMSMEHFLKI